MNYQCLYFSSKGVLRFQMAFTHLGHNADCFDITRVMKLPSPHCDDSGEVEVSFQTPLDPFDADDEFGEPEILPRIGDEYQVDLPPFIGEFACMLHKDAGTSDYLYENFVVGLPILLTWIRSQKYGIPGYCSESTTSSGFARSDSKNTNETEIAHGGFEPSPDWQNLPAEEKIHKIRSAGCRIVPGLSNKHWSAAEKDGFLLGLYIFEKNFVEVMRFIEVKDMSSLLSFYYGRFYGSQEYRRWSHYRKMKTKKCIFGQRIFSGSRKQELLSRIIPKVSEECRNALLEVSKTFADDEMSLADYVSSLKAMVGMNVLVEAVGIGTGKQDLTGMTLEPSRSNQVNPTRPEIPTGKACSSLTTTEIIKFLSGDYRLSKARSNDLFWEAVWPRLLARGWHSEQPKDQRYMASSQHCLVFLIPGVRKFSRSKLVKGDHYFDSVTDILGKVAKDPNLIELNSEGTDGFKNGEDYGCKDAEEEENNLPMRQRHCYLQPRTPHRRTTVMKFTVVDTSLSNGNIRELRGFPFENSDPILTQDCTEDSNEETSDESDVDAVTVVASTTSNLLPRMANSDVTRAFHQDEKHDVCPKTKNKKVSRASKVSKSELSQKQKQGNVDYEAVVIPKKQILIACDQKETSTCLFASSTGPRSACSINEVTENQSSQVGFFPDKLSSTSSLKGSPGECVEDLTPMDLNLPQIAAEFSKDQHRMSVKSDNQKPSSLEIRSDQQKQPNSLRHGTRNRPPTSRALEALVNGYLTKGRKRKVKDTESHASRPSQRARFLELLNESTNSCVDPQTEEGENSVFDSSNCNMFIKSHENEGPVSRQ